MTDTLQERELASWPEDEVPERAPSVAPTLPEPEPSAPKKQRWLGRKLARLTIGHLVAIVGTALVALGIVSSLVFLLLVTWLHDAAADATEWAEAETRLDQVGELATQQFLQATLAMRRGEGHAFVLESQSDAIAEQIDELITVVVEISGDPTFAERGAALHAANDQVTTAGVTGIENVLAGKIGADTMGIFELELGFASWRRYHNELSEAMGETQSAVLQTQSDRGSLAFVALIVIASLSMAVLGASSYLGRRARKREASLKAKVEDEKNLLHTIVNQLPESIAWKDSDLRLKGCNQATVERFVRAGVEPPLGSRVSSVAASEVFVRRATANEAMEIEVLETGEAIDGRQITIPDPDGPDRTVIRTVVPLKHKNRAIGVVSTARDVTQLVELERSLAAAGRLESIGQLSAGVAHEINTPVQFVSDNTGFLDTSFGEVIAALTSIAEIASKEDSDAVAAITKEADLNFLIEEIPDAIAQSMEGLQQIAQIVRAMKDFAHPGGDVGPTDINRLIDSTVAVSRNEWKYDAEMDLDLAEDLPQPHCDEGQIKQALLNIIVNAAHAISDSDSDKGTIAVATTSDDEVVTVRISDTGIGMADEVRARIFERFYTTKEVGRGSGQGLAIAYDAITSHGGTIEVESALGVGTTFTVTLPIAPPDA